MLLDLTKYLWNTNQSFVNSLSVVQNILFDLSGIYMKLQLYGLKLLFRVSQMYKVLYCYILQILNKIYYDLYAINY